MVKKSTNKPKASLVILIVLLILSLICLALEGVRIVDLGRTVSNQKADNDTYSQQVKALQARNNDLNQQLSQYTSSSINMPVLSIESAQHFNGVQTTNQFGEKVGALFDGDSDFVVVHASVKNEGTTLAYFSPSGTNLKLADNTTYSYYTLSNVGSQPRFIGGLEGYLASGDVEIKAQAIQAGQTVSGVLVYYAPKTIDAATLQWNDKSFAIEIKQL